MSRDPGSSERIKKISQMSLTELRAISDIDMSDKDLAEVIQAIHAGGAQPDTTDDYDSIIAEEAPSAATACIQPSTQLCAWCQQASEVSCSECVLCQTPVSNKTLQSIADWLDWQRRFGVWVAQHQPHLLASNL